MNGLEVGNDNKKKIHRTVLMNKRSIGRFLNDYDNGNKRKNSLFKLTYKSKLF